MKVFTMWFEPFGEHILDVEPSTTIDQVKSLIRKHIAAKVPPAWPYQRTVRFLWEGQPFNSEDDKETIGSLGVRNQDTISVHLEEFGGGYKVKEFKPADKKTSIRVPGKWYKVAGVTPEYVHSDGRSEKGTYDASAKRYYIVLNGSKIWY